MNDLSHSAMACLLSVKCDDDVEGVARPLSAFANTMHPHKAARTIYEVDGSLPGLSPTLTLYRKIGWPRPPSQWESIGFFCMFASQPSVIDSEAPEFEREKRLARSANPEGAMPKQAVSQIVYIIDDEEHLRDSLLNFFESMQIPAEAFDGAGPFLDAFDIRRSGCVLLDQQLPGMTGLELQAELASIGNPMPIIFMTGNASVPLSVSAMKAGAFDFLLKPFNSQAVANAVKLAFEKDLHTRRYLAEAEEIRACMQRLTPRETEVWGYVSQGLMNKQIAFEMSISEIMVKLHRGRMMKKMNARTVVDVVRKFDRIMLSESEASGPTAMSH